MTAAGALISGSTASLRATGVVRYVGALFLLVWLVGWVFGEIFAIGLLPVSRKSVFVLLFLLVWVPLWTLGGLAAFVHLLRSVAGEDSISVQASGIELLRRAGPFRRTRSIDRTAIRRVRIRHSDKALVLDTTSGTQVLTQFGTAVEREAIGHWLRQRLSIPEAPPTTDSGKPPATWKVSTEGGGARLKNHHDRMGRTRSLIAWLGAGLAALGWYASLGSQSRAGSVVVPVLALALVLWASWMTWGLREWIMRPGQITLHLRFATWESERTFKSARLVVEHQRDSDSDDRYKLAVSDANGQKTIYTQLYDSGELLDFARWIKRLTGFPITLPHGMQPSRTTPVSSDELRLGDASR